MMEGNSLSKFRADLHCHSTFSDGTLRPKELLQLAINTGLQGISITDHDTIDAYAEAIPLAEELGIRIIPGAEFSCRYAGISVHILGYAFDLDNPALQQFCQAHLKRREQRLRIMMEKLEEKGMPISIEGISLEGTIGRPHIAQGMVNAGYVKDVREAFNKYLGDKKPCFVPTESFSVEETIEVIHGAGGLAVIAHPHLIKYQKLLKHILGLPFDGIECYYARMVPTLEAQWIKIAKHKGWIMTGGSDFHGDIKPNNPLGCSWVDEETFQRLEEHWKR